MTFRGHSLSVVEGAVHPAYSLACFSPEGEEHDFRERYWNIQPGDVVVDVGASYGAYTLAALAAGAAFVYAFEPEPTVAVDLQRNIDLNGWGDRCRVGTEALWSEETEVDMREYAPHWPQQTISGPYQAWPLDHVLPRIERLDWVKLDVEGAEAEALKGARWALRTFHPVCIVECHTFLDPTLTDQCRAVLQQCGYDHFEFVQRPPCEMLIARKT
jgi:FkbM family methyltransferase